MEGHRLRLPRGLPRVIRFGTPEGLGSSRPARADKAAPPEARAVTSTWPRLKPTPLLAWRDLPKPPALSFFEVGDVQYSCLAPPVLNLTPTTFHSSSKETVVRKRAACDTRRAPEASAGDPGSKSALWGLGRPAVDRQIQDSSASAQGASAAAKRSLTAPQLLLIEWAMPTAYSSSLFSRSLGHERSGQVVVPDLGLSHGTKCEGRCFHYAESLPINDDPSVRPNAQNLLEDPEFQLSVPHP